VGVTAGLTNLDAEGGVPFTLPFSVDSTGTNPAEDVSLTVTLPVNAELTIEAASAEGASCTVSGTTATCGFGPLAAGEMRAASVTVRGLLAGNVVARARVTAINDRLASNNSREIAVKLRSGIDAGVMVSTDQEDAPLGGPLEIYADVRSLRALPVRNAVLSLNLNQPVIAASMPGGNCTVSQFSVVCNIGEIAAGSGARLTLNTITNTAGPLYAAASVIASGDGDHGNNTDRARAWVQAERDIELTAGSASVDLGVGAGYEIPFLVRSRGPQPTGEVTLSISIPSSAVVVDSIDGDGATCGAADLTHWTCRFGAMAPGVAHLVRVAVHGTRAATLEVNAVAEAADDGYLGNNSAALQLRIDNLVDVAVLMASGGTGLEDEDLEGQVTLQSGGREAATNATLDLELSAAGELREVAIHGGTACELLSGRRARCALPTMARGAQLYVNYRATFADPGTYEVKFALQAPGDTASANDTLTRPVLVRPFYDVAVSGQLDLSDLVVGGTRETEFTVSAARRPLSAVRFTARNFLPGLRVAAIHSNAGGCDCRVDDVEGGICDISNLGADSSVAVAVTWKAEAAVEADVSVAVSTASDVVSANNAVRSRTEVLAPADLELQVATSVGAVSGATVDFPPISIVNGGTKAVGTRLEVTLPAEVTLVSVSAANALCSGTGVLSCDFGALDANTTSTVNISVRAGASGNHAGALKLTSINDTNPANDSREVMFQISASPAVTAPKSGGGGRFEWLTLVLLGLLKWGLTPFARKWGQPPFARNWGLPPFTNFVQR
jgi:hypothetical protein